MYGGLLTTMKRDFKFNVFNIKESFEKAFNSVQENNTKRRRRQPWWVLLLLTLVILFVYYFVRLPSLSPMSYDLYFTIILGLGIYWVLALFFGRRPKLFFPLRISAFIALVCVLFPAILTFIGSPIFMSRSYNRMIDVKPGVFDEEVEQINIAQVPVVDREAAAVIGEKEMGAVGDLVSQFDIAEYYSQINIAGKPIRVSPLQYNDFFKYLWNFREGIQYYVSVDMTTQEGELNQLAEPIFYSSSDYLLRDLKRHLRFQYPFWLLGETNFEIDDNGKAYYVTPKLTNRIALFNAPDTAGVIITDANSGESTYYDNSSIPEWVDRAYPSEYIINQLNWHGLYERGYFNTIFGQRNVRTTTEGYNYISLGTDIYLITGVTSVRSDTSNLGFYYVNLRTKEASFYQQPSATEYAAMESARGKVQEKSYVPTFPVILNIQGRPVYFMSLKDQSRTAKMFALVDAEQFTNVVVGDTVSEVIGQYYELNPGQEIPPDIDAQYEEFTIQAIHSVVEEGNTVLYFTTMENDKMYRVDPLVSGPRIIFTQEGDTLKVLTQESSSYEVVTHIQFPE